jgi:4-carboxymuconolactone decarboxylase
VSDDLYQRGMRMRRKVAGDAHVDRAEKNKTIADEGFQRYIVESAWGRVWTGEAIDLRTRSLLTIALLAALGHHEELAMHIRATKNTGATLDEIKEALMHVAVYAGVPAANAAFAVLKRVLQESES